MKHRFDSRQLSISSNYYSVECVLLDMLVLLTLIIGDHKMEELRKVFDNLLVNISSDGDEVLLVRRVLGGTIRINSYAIYFDGHWVLEPRELQAIINYYNSLQRAS